MKQSPKELDIVKSVRDLSETIPKGTKGAIVAVYGSDKPAFEVEFVDEEGETIDILTVMKEDLELILEYPS